MTKKTAKCLLVVFILISFIIPSCLTAFAGDTTTITLEVKYGQTEARSMLNMINSFRTGSEAWYWNENNSQKIYQNGLSKLEYDYNLEAIAMQRAAEIAVSFSHTRPDGTSCFTAFSGSGNTYYGENIAMGYTSASSVFEAWQETNEKYSGQGHRRNMLNENFTQIGIGHCYVDGYHYWVQEFGNKASGVAKTPAEDGNKTVKITALNSLAGKYTTTTTKQTTTTTTTKPSTTKQTTTKQSTTTTTKPTTTTTKPTTATTTKPATMTAKQTTTTTKPTTATTAITTAATETKANSTTKAVSDTAADTTTAVTSAANTNFATEAASTTIANSTANTQATEPTTVGPSINAPSADEETATETATEQAPGGSNTALYIGMATAAVIAAAGICTFVFIRSRKK